jgi:hypothetical protein
MKTRFKFCPADIIRGYGGPYRGEALGVWQWFVQRLAEYVPRETPYEWINGTSSINNHEPWPTGGEDFWVEPRRRVRELLLRAGQKNRIGLFLRKCQIPSWASLNRSIIATVRTSDNFPNSDWFKMTGRTFKKSPNSCHSGAISVHGVTLELSQGGKLWGVRVEYGYPHDSSSWYWRIRQSSAENLDDFVVRVDAEIDAAMVPDTVSDRQYWERQWWETYKSLRGVFFDEHIGMPEWEKELADAIGKIDGASMSAHRIRLTRSRLATLKRWAKQK